MGHADHPVMRFVRLLRPSIQLAGTRSNVVWFAFVVGWSGLPGLWRGGQIVGLVLPVREFRQPGHDHPSGRRRRRARR
jgi:hypothetical protein